MRTLAAILVTAAATGCVVYDEQLVYEDTGAPHTDDRPGDAPEPVDPEPAEPLWLSPAGGLQGDVIIVSLVGDGTVDLTGVTDLTFYGDGALDVLATAHHGHDEYLLTVSIPTTAERSDNHLLVTLDDGSTWFVEDAFAVVGDPEEIPPSTGGSGGGCP